MIRFKPEFGSNKQKPPASEEWHELPFTVLYDHREREGGWRFAGLRGGTKEKNRPLLVKSREIHMPTADYTAEADIGDLFGDTIPVPVLIERKSHPDLLGSLSGGHVNFRKEHERMARLVEETGYFCCVIVESSLSALLAEVESPECTRGASAELILSASASWPQKYGVPWYFAGDRRTAERLALKVIHKAWEQWESRTV